MRFKISNFLCALVVGTASVSCTSTLDLEYAFELQQRTSDGPLEFIDENFAFTFQAVPSGIYFSIRNLSDQSAYLDWQHCFFVEPNGNTFNALNTDVLDESSEVSRRSAHRTQIPSNTVVGRFTTSTVNTQESNLVTVNEVGSMLSSTSINWTSTTGWTWDAETLTRSSAYYAGSLVTASRNLWSARRYWPKDVRAEPRTQIAALQRVTDGVKSQVPMALGLRIVHGEAVLDYRFDFPLVGIFASGNVKNYTEKVTERRLRYFALRQDDWAWRSGDEFGKPLAMEAEGAVSEAP